jgi:3-oxoacyl-[acyl-carrier protein] reductase
MNLSLENKNALVCGASKGIGKAIAIELSRMGASITVMARNTENLKEVLAELSRDLPSQDHQFLVADFQDPETVLTRVKSVLTQRNFHILINNSGGPKGGPILQAEAEEFSKAFHQHIIFSHNLTQLLLEGMKKDSYGRIVNVISTSVKEPIPGLGVSNTIRGAMGNWAKSMAMELGPHGITINNLLPGFTNTQRLKEIIADKANKSGKTESEIAREMMNSVPLGRFAEPQEIAHTVGFLVSPSAGYITGINVPVDGGRTKSL